MREAGEHVTQVGVGIKAAAAAAFDDRVEDGSALAGSGFADEEPVLFPDGGGTDGVFDQVVVGLPDPGGVRAAQPGGCLRYAPAAAKAAPFPPNHDQTTTRKPSQTLIASGSKNRGQANFIGQLFRAPSTG